MEKYLATFAEDALLPLPDGVELPGSPDDYRFPTFVLSAFGHFESEEAAGRILLGLAQHGEWKAITMSGFGDSIIAELEAMQADDQDFEFPHSQLVFPDGPRRIRQGIDELIKQGLLGSDHDGEWTIWPTLAFVERAAPYRVSQPA